MKLTRQQAINQNCKACIYDPLAGGTWVAQVENCEIQSCPMYEYRPMTLSTRQSIRDERYSNLSDEEREIADKKADIARERFGHYRNSISNNIN